MPFLQSEPTYIFLQQRYTQFDKPPVIQGYQLIQNRFCDEKPRLLGLKFSDTMPGYFYAVYQRNEQP
jgi:hypothetical protein